MASDDHALPPGPLLRVHTDRGEGDQITAQQGPAPADAARRPVPPVPVPSREGLGAEETEALVGSGNEVAETSRQLAQAEGLDPDTES